MLTGMEHGSLQDISLHSQGMALARGGVSGVERPYALYMHTGSTVPGYHHPAYTLPGVE